MVADDLTAVESVLKADVKRTELLDECKKLESAQDKGDITVQDRLKEVSVHADKIDFAEKLMVLSRVNLLSSFSSGRCTTS